MFKKIFLILLLAVAALAGPTIIEQFDKIYLRDTASTNKVGVVAPSLAGSYNLTLPTTDGNASECLRTDGAGILSWAACAASGGSPGGVDTNIQYNNAGAFGGASKLNWDETNKELEIGGSTSGVLSIKAAATTTSYSLELPSTGPVDQKVLRQTSSSGAPLSWGRPVMPVTTRRSALVAQTPVSTSNFEKLTILDGSEADNYTQWDAATEQIITHEAGLYLILGMISGTPPSGFSIAGAASYNNAAPGFAKCQSRNSAAGATLVTCVFHEIQSLSSGTGVSLWAQSGSTSTVYGGNFGLVRLSVIKISD